MSDFIAAQIKAYKDWISTGFSGFPDQGGPYGEAARLEGHNHVVRILESMRLELLQLVGETAELDEIKEFLCLFVGVKTWDDIKQEIDRFNDNLAEIERP